eukprot:4217633-Pyramimonas_sp.AAC.1
MGPTLGTSTTQITIRSMSLRSCYTDVFYTLLIHEIARYGIKAALSGLHAHRVVVFEGDARGRSL